MLQINIPEICQFMVYFISLYITGQNHSGMYKWSNFTLPVRNPAYWIITGNY